MSLPSLNPSGATWAQLVANNGHILELLIAANLEVLSPSQIALVRKAEATAGFPPGASLQAVWDHANIVVTNYLGGDPDPQSPDAQAIEDSAWALATLATCVDEIGALIAANPGTIVVETFGGGRPSTLQRVF